MSNGPGEERLQRDRAYLHAHGIDVEPATLSELVREVVGRMPGMLRDDPRSELTPEEVATLERGGGDLTPRDLASEDPVARGVAEMAALVGRSLTTKQAAEFLGVDPSRVRQRLADRTLYGFRWAGQWRVPMFQFDEEGLVRGLEEIIPLLDPDLSPLEVYLWLTTPDAELRADNLDRDLTPLEWLRLGFTMAPLRHIAKHL
jgi:hypothetical protein